MPRRLSKTDYVTGVRCARALWYRVREPHRRSPRPPDQQRLVRAGDDVDAYAQSVYPGGASVTARELDRAASETATHLRAGARRIYQGTWITDWGGFRADIADVDGGDVVLREVKASLQPHPHHRTDLAFQSAVLAHAGWDTERALVVHLDPHARAPDPPLVECDVTDEVAALQPAVAETAARLARVVDGDRPSVTRGSKCVVPHRCPFLEACWGPLPSPSVLDVPGLPDARLDREVAAGVRAAGDVRRSGLSAVAKRYLGAVDAGPRYDRRILHAWSRALVEPVSTLVLGGPRPPIADLPGHGPYDLVLEAAGVATPGRPPRGWVDADPERLGAWLSTALDDRGSVVVFGRSDVLHGLQRLAPAVDRRAVEIRLSDVEPIVHHAVDHPLLGRRRSLGDLAAALVGGGIDEDALTDAPSVPVLQRAADRLLGIVRALQAVADADGAP